MNPITLLRSLASGHWSTWRGGGEGTLFHYVIITVYSTVKQKGNGLYLNLAYFSLIEG